MLISSGAVAGLGGAEQVIGVYSAFYDNFSPGLRLRRHRGRDAGQFQSDRRRRSRRFLFGALNSGSAVLQMTTGLSKYLVQVLQFLIVLMLAAQILLELAASRRARAADETSVGVINEPEPHPTAEEA